MAKQKKSKVVFINVIGRRWFQTTYGNTYHSVEVNIERFDGSTEYYKNDFSYGYGEQYKMTAQKIVAEYLPDVLRLLKQEDRKDIFLRWSSLQALKAKNVRVNFTCHDVDRKKDL